MSHKKDPTPIAKKNIGNPLIFYNAMRADAEKQLPAIVSDILLSKNDKDAPNRIRFTTLATGAMDSFALFRTGFLGRSYSAATTEKYDLLREQLRSKDEKIVTINAIEQAVNTAIEEALGKRARPVGKAL